LRRCTVAKLDTDESGAVERDEYRRFVEKKHEWTSEVGRCRLTL